MGKKDQFKNEIDFRDQLKESRVVIEVTDKYTIKNEDFKSAISSYNLIGTDVTLDSYHYALEMPYADRNLHTIHLSEQLDTNKIRSYTHELAKALKQLNEKNLIHGDVKLSNIVRVGGRIKLIDLD